MYSSGASSVPAKSDSGQDLTRRAHKAKLLHGLRRQGASLYSLRQCGFTMTELVAVMLITGILAAVALPRFFDRTEFDAKGYTDQTMALLRYGQKLAIGQNTSVYVALASNYVALCYDSLCTNKVTAASGGNSGSSVTQANCGSTSWACEGMPNGASFSAVNGAATSYVGTSPKFFFSDLGKPYNLADTPPAGASSFTSAIQVTISGANNTFTYAIEAETGYVHR